MQLILVSEHPWSCHPSDQRHRVVHTLVLVIIYLTYTAVRFNDSHSIENCRRS